MRIYYDASRYFFNKKVSAFIYAMMADILVFT